MFLAESVWWIASIIGLQQGLVIDSDNLKKWSEATLLRATPQAKYRIKQRDKSQQGGEKSVMPHNISGD
jgi:hypothetical protein